MRIKLAVYAIPFGFGPVSKAVAVVHAINKILDVEWCIIGQSISLEFFKREFPFSKILDRSDLNEQEFKATRSELDGAIVLMDPEFANILAPFIPVFYVDSLGFMWSENNFSTYPYLYKMQRYFVQNIFGSYENMLTTKLMNLVPVSPILDLDDEISYKAEKRNVIHLGGLLNPLNVETSEVYLEGALAITKLMNVEKPLILKSNAGRDRFIEHLNHYEVQALPHKEMISTLKAANFIWSSPGLTAMLEMAFLGLRTAPLPPQNYSQVLNIKNMVKAYGDELHAIWHFLNKEYEEIKPGMPEEIGVERVTELNAAKLKNISFQTRFSTLAKQAYEQMTVLPQTLAAKCDGATQIAQDIKSFFESDRDYLYRVNGQK